MQTADSELNNWCLKKYFSISVDGCYKLDILKKLIEEN